MLHKKTIQVVGTSAVDLGATPEQAAMIEREGWSIVWAPRPLGHIWISKDGDAIEGAIWQQHGYFAAGDPNGELPGETTLADLWEQADAQPVKVVTPQDLLEQLRDTPDFDQLFPAYVDLVGGDEDEAIIEMARANMLI